MNNSALVDSDEGLTMETAPTFAYIILVRIS